MQWPNEPDVILPKQGAVTQKQRVVLPDRQIVLPTTAEVVTYATPLRPSICERCGEPVSTAPSANGGGRPRRYCSERCRDHTRRRTAAAHRDFLSFDGEMQGTRYVLLACSDGRELVNTDGIGTVEALEFLLDTPAGSHNVWFGGGLDWNCILRDLPVRGAFGSYEALHRTGHTVWGGYRIRYKPKKLFAVSRGEPGSSSYKSFVSTDTLGFFQCSFEKACGAWLGDVPPIIAHGKREREHFDRWPLADVRAYNQAELQALVTIMCRLRGALSESDLMPHRYDGAGSVAAALMKREKINEYYAPWPFAMDEAVASAAHFGRIDVGGIGEFLGSGFDLNSAYPAALCLMPDMRNLSWKICTTNGLPDEPFAICFVEWEVDEERTHWGPFPYRNPGGSILWPTRGAGWYYQVEVAAALRRFPRRITIRKAWVPAGSYSTPLDAVIRREFETRRRFKTEGNAAEKVVKLGLNSLFGKTAQRQLTRYRIPPYRNYFFSGFCTAIVRARINHAIVDLGEENVFLVATDGIICNGTLPTSDDLGDWSNRDVSRVIILKSGVYETYGGDGSVQESKTRGYGKEPLQYEAIHHKWWSARYDFEPEKVIVRRFIGMGLAIASGAYRDKFLTFADLPKALECPLLVGTSKRVGGALVGHERHVFLPPRETSSNDPSTPYRPAMLTTYYRHTEDHEDECE